MRRTPLFTVSLLFSSLLLTTGCVTEEDPLPAETDGDSIADDIDNCPEVPNPGQSDFDLDGIGDLCDNDADGDSVSRADDCHDLDPAMGLGEIFFPDTDSDGLGDPSLPTRSCAPPEGFVSNADDLEPDCTTNDTDECEVCGGANLDMDCEGICFGTSLLDECEVCNGPGILMYFPDDDEDGLGDPSQPLLTCDGPEGFVLNGDDTEPDCATNDTDFCGVCGGPGLTTYYPDTDEDGLGDARSPVDACESPMGFVDNGDDMEPECATNDTDVCDICSGPGTVTYFPDVDEDGLGDERSPIEACEPPLGYVANGDDLEPDCDTNDTDECGVCAGENLDIDCTGTCFGGAFLDGCDNCVGGGTGVEPSQDSDFDGIPDACDLCPVDVERFIIQWTGILPYEPPGGPYTFQLVLYETGDFQILYEAIENFDATATVGWQGQDGEDFVELAYNSDYPNEISNAYMAWVELEDESFYSLEYTMPYLWVDISTSAENLNLPDDGSQLVALGFDFPFLGETYSQATILSNGVLAFTSGEDGLPGYRNYSLPETDLGALIAPFWDDLNPEFGGTIHAYHAPATCDPDCEGMYGGVAFLDECGVCVGGTSGIEAGSTVDCNLECFGAAYKDSCGYCVGGSTGLEPSEPEDCPQGPDLTVLQGPLQSSMYVDYVDVGDDSCYVAEGCVLDIGMRRVIRFDTVIANIGNQDLYIGSPWDEEGPYYDYYIWDPCHAHYHLEGYASYDLYDVESEEILPIGQKTGFCVLDWAVYDTELTADGGCAGYDCADQGISRGCQDTYESSLQCQWIDITDISDGVYDLIVTTNPDDTMPDIDASNNRTTVRFSLTGDDVEVIVTD